jgi:hypothetical protein
MGSFLQRRDSSSTTSGGSGSCAPDVKESAALPALVEFLASTSYGTGEARQTGTMLVFRDQGRWKACLNDRDQGLVAFLTVDELVDLALTVDLAIQGGKLDWRASRARGERRK